ncbi:hypothetical protein L602_001500000090 [Cupriavidus gilardii J11]|uniref:Uncharacterized protein n=1 Tax=Cupriavidus gilardii J11 TaxID=936133 RepID=A0A562BRH1_9BURK|nr:hypothetical protein [Cupriavidus gilardii]TWG87876.1 hypothetical protein L602_001500000090 [Cupriavidus gilardii J11]
MPLYNVDVIYRAVIHAADPSAAYDAAMCERRAIDDESREPRYELAGKVLSSADLAHGWTDQDRPHGGNGSSIGELLKHEQCHPDRDTRTIDMFETDSHD